MKNKINKIFIILIVLITLVLSSKVYAVTPTLEDIVNTFNNCSTIKQYAESGVMLSASQKENKINIVMKYNEVTSDVEFILKDNILSTNISGETDDVISKVMSSMILIDCIGQLHGYSEGELGNTLNSEQAENYTIDREGFELKEIQKDSYDIKIDISKKIPLADFSNTYFEVSDFKGEVYEKYITGDGFAEDKKGNVYFNKSGNDGKNTLLIAEKGELTKNAYKSALSIIEVIFEYDKKIVNYFQENYGDLFIENKLFTGFNIEVNPTKTTIEESLIPSNSGIKFVRITIDETLAKSAIKTENSTPVTNTNINNNNVSNNANENNNTNISNSTNTTNNTALNSTTDKSQANKEIPKTGSNYVIKRSALGIIVIALAVLVCFVIYDKRLGMKNETK